MPEPKCRVPKLLSQIRGDIAELTNVAHFFRTVLDEVCKDNKVAKERIRKHVLVRYQCDLVLNSWMDALGLHGDDLPMVVNDKLVTEKSKKIAD
jgi:hypothetical protein